MQKNKKTQIALLFRCLVLIVLVLGLWVWAVGGYRLYTCAQYYDKDPEIILTQCPEGIEFFGSVSMEEDGLLQHKAGILSGKIEIGKMELTKDGNIIITPKTRIGKLKVMILDNDNQVVAFEELAKDESKLSMKQGTYRIFLVGRYFTGTTTFETQKDSGKNTIA